MNETVNHFARRPMNRIVRFQVHVNGNRAMRMPVDRGARLGIHNHLDTFSGTQVFILPLVGFAAFHVAQRHQAAKYKRGDQFHYIHPIYC